MKNLLIMSAAVLALSACGSSKKEMSDGVKNEANTAMESAKEDVATKTSTVTEPAAAAASEATSGVSSTCTLDKDSRVIEVAKTTSGGCELFYTKFGEKKSVATSGFGVQYCEEVKDRIQSNLDKAGFACQ